MEKIYENVFLGDIISCVTPMNGFSFNGSEKILIVGYEVEFYCSCKGGTAITHTTDNFLSSMAWIGNPAGNEWVGGGPYNTTAVKSITCEVPKDPNNLIKSTSDTIGGSIDGITTSTALWSVAVLVIAFSLIFAIQEGIFDLINKNK